MTKQDWENLFVEAMNALRNASTLNNHILIPYDTGNLKLNAFKGKWLNDNTFQIYFDESVAPYVPYTQEEWKNGNNPNAGWVERAMMFLAEYIAGRLGGKIE